MNTQTLTKPATIISNLLVTLPEQPIYASSRDYGFDFDEEELARELLAPLPASLIAQANYEVEAYEIESYYL